MKKQMTATLVYETSYQRFYKLNEKISVAPNMFGRKNASILDSIKDEQKTFKEEYKHLCPTDGIDLICISDAHTHTERIVFAALMTNNGKPGRLHTQLDGYNTFMIHGGDSDAVYPDHVYLRRIANVNGFQFHYKNLIPA